MSLNSAGLTTSNLTSGFIDLATYDESEKFMYGGPDSTAYFVRETRKSTWFTLVPVCLTKASGQPGFGQEWSVNISRAGDYLLQSWLRVRMPSVCLYTGTGVTGANANATITVNGQNFATTQGFALRWCNNLGHNLIKQCVITFNDLVAAQFDSWHLDFWAAFTVPASKRYGYDRMIGNVGPLAQASCAYLTSPTSGVVTATAIPSEYVNVPLPLFFTRDSGVALPTAALPYNEMRIQFQFRDVLDLLVLQSYDNVPANLLGYASDATFYGTVFGQTRFPMPTAPQLNQISFGSYPNPASPAQQASSAPPLNECQVWANYAIVANEERKRMACAPRDILIEQVQTAPLQTFNSNGQSNQPSFDIRFSHAIKALFFAVQNTTINAGKSQPGGSIYTTDLPIVLNASSIDNLAAEGITGVTGPGPVNGSVNGPWPPYVSVGSVLVPGQLDPIAVTSLVYENTQRLSQMGSDYFSLVNPWYHAPSIPERVGYHCYSYSLDFYALDPMGSTNYGKLTNVSILPQATDACTKYASGAQNAAATSSTKSTYQFITTAVNNNIIRVSGGALGFPVL